MSHDLRKSLRRALIRESTAAWGSLLLFGKLQACAREEARGTEPSANSGAGGGAARLDPATGGANAVTGGSPASSGAGAKSASDGAQPNASADLPVLPDEDAGTAREPRIACASAFHFPPIVDDAPRSAFTRMDQGSQLEWLGTGISASLYATQLPDCILGMLRALDALHGGYPNSMLAHSLQVATRARRANASDELVLCALCHHLGNLLTFEGQAELSAAILRGFVSENGYRIVRHQQEYQVSEAGPSGLRARYAAEPWNADALRFCDEWDSPSYDTGYATLPLSEFEPLVRASFGPDKFIVSLFTSTDCISQGT